MQISQAKYFHDLHTNGKLLVLPNVWDVIGALLMEDVGFVAIGTSSAAMAFSNGYTDGEQMPFLSLLQQTKRISNKVRVPVTVDLESGYADSLELLEKNVKALLLTGIVGLNIEDTNSKNHALTPIIYQVNKIKTIRSVANALGIDVFINARIDVYLSTTSLTEAEKYKMTVNRANTYLEAGANGIFPIGMKDTKTIEQLVREIPAPINVLVLPGVPNLQILENIGVARASVGAGFLKRSLGIMREFAKAIIEHKDVFSNENDDLKMEEILMLIEKSKGIHTNGLR